MQVTFSLLAALVSVVSFTSAVPIVARQAGQTLTGVATFYATGLGSCGITNNDSELVAATSYGKAVCGDTATVTRGDKSVTVTLVDTCPGCDGSHIDLSPAAFNQLGTPDEGVIPVTWIINASGSGGSTTTTPPATTTTAAAAPPAPPVTSAPAATPAPPSGAACTEGAIICNPDNTWSQCGSGLLQLQGAVPPGMKCVDGAFSAA